MRAWQLVGPESTPTGYPCLAGLNTDLRVEARDGSTLRNLSLLQSTLCGVAHRVPDFQRFPRRAVDAYRDHSPVVETNAHAPVEICSVEKRPTFLDDGAFPL